MIIAYDNPFIMTVNTALSGVTANNQFTLALTTGTYDYRVDWGDGNEEHFTDSTNRIHTYPSSGIYTIKIRGLFPRFYYNNGNDATKIISIDKWGDYSRRTTSQQFAFLGANNNTSLPPDDSDKFSLVGSFFEAWSNNNLTEFPFIDTSNGNSVYGAWDGNQLTEFPLINTSNVQDFRFAWRNNNLTEFPLIDTSSGQYFRSAWENNLLTEFPLIDINNGFDFAGAWAGNDLLTDFPSGFFDSWSATPIVICFFNAWVGCTSLTAQSVENILVSIDTSGVNAPAGTGTETDITIDYDVGTGSLSAATNTAITNLKAKGWTPHINGVYV